MRSLFFEMPEADPGLMVDLLNLQKEDLKIDLPSSAEGTGILFRLPEWLSGIFYLNIKGKDYNVLRKVSIQ